MTAPGRLAGKVALVTAAGGGIGAAVSRRLAAEGARVAVTDADGERSAQVAEQLPTATSWRLDVRDPDAVRTVRDQIVAEYGPIDILVNNAYSCRSEDILADDDAVWQRDIDTVLRATIDVTRAIVPRMLVRSQGSVVMVGSVNALSAFGNDAYSAAKAALLSVTRSLAVRCGRHAVRVNAVLPGTVRTPGWDARLARDPQVFDRLARHVPLGRVGEPDDVAGAVAFLASRDAAWITGSAIVVDGGLLAGNLAVMEAAALPPD